jgi:hypothetical protein
MNREAREERKAFCFSVLPLLKGKPKALATDFTNLHGLFSENL